MQRVLLAGFVAASVVLGAVGARAHITPPVVLLSDRQAVRDLLAGAQKLYLREVRLSAADRRRLAQRWALKPSESVIRFYIGRSRVGALTSVMLFKMGYTVHGPVRVAIALSPTGDVDRMRVVQLSEEMYYWANPLLRSGLESAYRGLDPAPRGQIPPRFQKIALQSMQRFVLEVISDLVREGALLYRWSMDQVN